MVWTEALNSRILSTNPRHSSSSISECLNCSGSRTRMRHSSSKDICTPLSSFIAFSLVWLDTGHPKLEDFPTQSTVSCTDLHLGPSAQVDLQSESRDVGKLNTKTRIRVAAALSPLFTHIGRETRTAIVVNSFLESRGWETIAPGFPALKFWFSANQAQETGPRTANREPRNVARCCILCTAVAGLLRMVPVSLAQVVCP